MLVAIEHDGSLLHNCISTNKLVNQPIFIISSLILMSYKIQYILGVIGFSKMDVFLENSQTAFDPPPLVFGNYIALFSRKSAKYA